MENSKAYYKLTSKRASIENDLEMNDILVREYREQAKKLKKGSIERQELIKKANEIVNSENYKILKSQLAVMNFCINTVFYS